MFNAFAFNSLPMDFTPDPVSNEEPPIAHVKAPSQNKSRKSPILAIRFEIIPEAPLIEPITPLSISNAFVILSMILSMMPPRKFSIKHKAASRTFEIRSLSIPLMKLPRSLSRSLNKQDINPPTSLSCFLTALSKSGFGILSASRPFCTSLLVSLMTTPLILAVIPLNFFSTLSATLFILLCRSTNLPVLLSIHSPTSF